jgi:hypothetical protein
VKVPSIKPSKTSPKASTEPNGVSEDVQPTGFARGLTGYFRRLWRAELPLSRVFWQDMAVVGTLLNLAAMALAFVAVALGASTPIGIAIFMTPIPYSIFLVAAVWRRADRESTEWAWPARIGALAWLVIAFLI